MRGLSFRSRLTAALLVAALLPLAALTITVFLMQPTAAIGPLLLVLSVIVLLVVPLSLVLAGEVVRPIREILASVDRVADGEAPPPLPVSGDDEVGRLARSHQRLAADLARRSGEVGRILEAIARMSPEAGVDELAARAGPDAESAFGLIDASVVLGPASAIPELDVVPGETRPLRAVLHVGSDEMGVLLGWLPATRQWTRPDQDLFELYASEVAVALRNAELFARVEAQNAQLRELDAAKDEFLRGVSHNLQSPLTSIRAYAELLDQERPDRRLEIIAEQSERLSRMVRQLLTVSRLESGAIRPHGEVLNLGARVRRAWEALAVADVGFSLEDRSGGWLTVADPDQLDQVLWALLDNAVKYGGRTPVSVAIATDETDGRLRLTISDSGPGVAEADRGRMFTRFGRGSGATDDGGSGLGLYVSRELCWAMGGDLLLEPAREGSSGAAFTVVLPAEAAHE